MRTKEDLLSLLNDIKSSEIGNKAYPIAMRQLNYYCNPNRYKNRYCRCKIPKKMGGFRCISIPNKGLKNIQSWLNLLLTAIYVPSSYAMGFAVGRSVTTNGNAHIGKNYVLNLDLQDFFPSISQARIWKRIQLSPFNFPVEIANVVAGICCMKTVTDGGQPKYELPQGAPTSPLLTNAICDTLDRRLEGLARRFGLQYTRYADDITFSSMHHVYAKEGEFMQELRRIIKDQGFTVNEKKTRLQTRGQRQEVTGLIVNKKLNVTRRYTREMRQLLYIWERYGYSVAYTRFYPRYKAEKGHVKKGQPDLQNVLSGKLLYLKMVRGEQDNVYQRLNAQFQKLLAEQSKKINTIGENPLNFLETFTIPEFEALHQSVIEVSPEPQGFKAFFKRGDKIQWIKLSSHINEFDRGLLRISYCIQGNRKFYMLHRPLAENTTDAPHYQLLNRFYESGFDLNTLTGYGQ